jgi:hypothetical protein
LVAYHPEKISARASFSKKNLSSDGHFGRPFSFMGMKGKLQNQKERDHLNNNPSLKKITTSYLRKEQP